MNKKKTVTIPTEPWGTCDIEIDSEEYYQWIAQQASSIGYYIRFFVWHSLKGLLSCLPKEGQECAFDAVIEVLKDSLEVGGIFPPPYDKDLQLKLFNRLKRSNNETTNEGKNKKS